MPHQIEVEDMPTKIRERLYIGSKNSIGCMQCLRDLKITAILNCADNVEHSKELAAEFKCLRVGLKDHDNQNPRYLVETAVETLRRLMSAGETVIVHCHAGAHRSVTVVALYLVATEYRTFKSIWEEIKSLRSVVGQCHMLPEPFREGTG